jgi:hypothetical protein
MTGYFPGPPEQDVCLLCGLETWSCICSPLRPNHKATPAELEQARAERLTRAEREAEHEIAKGKR